MSDKMIGARIIVETLIREGVEVIFGYPGGTVLDLYNELARTDKIWHILTRHEQGAAHAADGYARSSGKVGVCVATSGPGATNLTTGLATAYMDATPMVAITGQVPLALIGNDAFQEADVCGVTRSITKHNFLVKDVKDLAQTIREAFHIAKTGKPGPVLIDIPKDIQQAETKFVYPETVEIRSYKPTEVPNMQQVKRAAAMFKDAKKPLLYVGGGAISSGAHDEIYELATRCNIPVVTTLLGLGAFPGNHPLSLGMLGMHGTVPANYATQECDLLLALGSRFDDRVTGKLPTFAPNAKIIHVDIDPTSLSKNVRAHVPIVGDLRLSLQELLKHVGQAQHEEWIEQVETWKRDYPLDYDREASDLKPQYVVETIYNVSKGQAIMVSDVGQNQMWVAQYYRFTRPRTHLSSGGLGTMGFGFPAAIGAQVANPGKLVVNVSGDGGIQMNIQELATAVLNDLPVKVFILNNGYLGMVRQWQQMFYNRVYSSTNLTPEGVKHTEKEQETHDYVPDFVKVAEAYGAVGMRVTEKDDVEEAIRTAFSTPKCVVVEFRVTQEENVFPMVPAGASLSQVITERFSKSSVLAS